MDELLVQTKQAIIDALMLGETVNSLGDDDDLNATLGIDSVGFLQVLTSLEETFGVAFEDVLISRHGYNTPRKLAELVSTARRFGDAG